MNLATDKRREDNKGTEQEEGPAAHGAVELAARARRLLRDLSVGGARGVEPRREEEEVVVQQQVVERHTDVAHAPRGVPTHAVDKDKLIHDGSRRHRQVAVLLPRGGPTTGDNVIMARMALMWPAAVRRGLKVSRIQRHVSF